ncbi:unnamed protein product [Miscanthus lutarioriparius]|uniref:WRKY domain-containing protein n=1 Tax=Miscanthus lutarioriparius TaxID=422564 RepID=A0A811RDV4_9POAL|nr:unnamed protein product [Miscanthus lutarioriparius]
MAAAAAVAAAPYARVMEDMVKGREYATQLQALLRDSPDAGRLLDRILHAMSRTIDTAKAAAAAAEEEASEVQSDVTCTAGSGKRKAAGGGDKRAACRKRGQQGSSVVTKNTKDLEDGHAWRKYGQKEIQNCKYPKAYFRCTHKYDQQCVAQRQVQRRDDDPDTYTVTYIGVHTCRDPATAIAHADAGVADELRHAGSRLISFAANASAATTTSTTTTGNTTSQQAGHKDAAKLLAGPLKLEAGGEQEEVLSSLTPAAEAMRNAAATTPGGPDQGDVTSVLQLQQHCYGGELADMARFSYDDTFDLQDIVVFGFDHC